MDTFIIQYQSDGHWKNYQGTDDQNIEFLSLIHAQQIARIICRASSTLYVYCRICDSHGNYHPVC